MKRTFPFVCIAVVLFLNSCKKKDETHPDTPPSSTDNYSSTEDFLAKNDVAMQTYTVDGAAGGSFNTPKGTIVNVSPNAFHTYGNVPVTGPVTVQFKDIYKKSDMLFSRAPTMTATSAPLKSGGEFYLKALSNNAALLLNAPITVQQPVAITGGFDSLFLMHAFIGQIDTAGNNTIWQIEQDSLIITNYAANYYLTSLNAIGTQPDSGTWCSSDNGTFFASYPQVTLTFVPTQNPVIYDTDVFLIFTGISSMVHVYRNGSTFPYSYAPTGLHCTLVAVGVNGGTLYSSFVPITITSNQTVNFSLSPTTTDAFKLALYDLN